MKKIRILAFAGSTRSASFNKKLLSNAIRHAKKAGAIVTHIDLREMPMPLYDGDFEKENGIPENGKKLMDLMIEHDAFIIASPEYNSSFSGVLKNSLDWASRPVEGYKPLAAFSGKPVLLLSASNGTLGGLRGLYSLRAMLANIKALVVPEQLALSKARTAFDENDEIIEEKMQKRLEKMIKKFVGFVERAGGYY